MKQAVLIAIIIATWACIPLGAQKVDQDIDEISKTGKWLNDVANTALDGWGKCMHGESSSVEQHKLNSLVKEHKDMEKTKP